MAKLITKYGTTDDDFTKFKELCEKYRGYMGLFEWHFEYIHGTMSKNTDGECYTEHSAKRVTICLGKRIDFGHDLCYIAKHEVAEALLGSIYWCARQWIAVEMVDEYRHEVINHVVGF